MPMSPLLPPLPHVASVELLHRVAGLLEASLLRRPGPLMSPNLVVVAPRGDHVAVGVTALDDDPPDVLCGLVAPDAWWALGVVAPARWRPADRPPTARGGDGLDVIHLVARTGDAVTVRSTRGVATGDRTTTTGRPWAGFLDDHLRRSLGLPTAPAPASTLGLWAAVWLDALVERRSRGELTGARWPELAGHHPVLVAARRAGADPATLAWCTAHLARAGRLLADAWSWRSLRANACAGRDALGATTPEVAAWMDEGLYARSLLARFPAPADLLGALAELLGADLHRELQQICRAWGIQR